MVVLIGVTRLKAVVPVAFKLIAVKFLKCVRATFAVDYYFLQILEPLNAVLYAVGSFLRPRDPKAVLRNLRNAFRLRAVAYNNLVPLVLGLYVFGRLPVAYAFFVNFKVNIK